MVRRREISHKKRVEEMDRMYDREVRRGIPNCKIWHRFIYLAYGITEHIFYNILSTSVDERSRITDDNDIHQLLLLKDENYK